jgi:hypothetical protein
MSLSLSFVFDQLSSESSDSLLEEGWYPYLKNKKLTVYLSKRAVVVPEE